MFKMLFGANKDIRLILCAFYNIYNVDRVFCRLIDKSKFGKVQGSNIDFYTSYNILIDPPPCNDNQMTSTIHNNKG